MSSLCSASSESYEEIQSTLTQLESCMRLLSPDFEPPHLQPSSSTSSSNGSSQQASTQQLSQEQLSEEQPCCSKDLKEPVVGGQKTGVGGKTSGLAEEEEKTSRGDGGTAGGSKGGGDMEEEEEEEEGSDAFIRSSGLITHTYNLDLEISPGNKLHFRIDIYNHTMSEQFALTLS